MAGAQLAHFRNFLGAARLGDRAAGVEAAARRRVDRGGDFAFEDDAPAFLFDEWIRDGHR